MSLPHVCTIKSEIGKHLINLIDVLIFNWDNHAYFYG